MERDDIVPLISSRSVEGPSCSSNKANVESVWFEMVEGLGMQLVLGEASVAPTK
ncbi:hypothetical protein SLEP1_g1840 [Rubroshorea leprosula]|uniref:Uncharacterized protein n=1 Tax=Rubroshorea leprosula TaxID=152421 RepID=A0AAV5HR00_9ROSI|nr:hypothetical protein SLEP1_g1840 [Rubroshorea leprosula]